jgi:hypothetical protein
LRSEALTSWSQLSNAAEYIQLRHDWSGSPRAGNSSTMPAHVWKRKPMPDAAASSGGRQHRHGRAIQARARLGPPTLSALGRTPGAIRQGRARVVLIGERGKVPRSFTATRLLELLLWKPVGRRSSSTTLRIHRSPTEGGRSPRTRFTPALLRAWSWGSYSICGSRQQCMACFCMHRHTYNMRRPSRIAIVRLASRPSRY